MPRNTLQRVLRIALFSVSICSPGQTPPSIKQESKDSTCSNIVALAGNIDIKCSNLTPAQRKIIEGIPAILNKILSNQIDPSVLMDKLEEISRDVKSVRRGFYQGYDFNGIKRRKSPGRDAAILGDEVAVFQNMISLNKAMDWETLLRVAEDQILKTPDWLTPYLFSGIANLKLGNAEAGISRLQFVRSESGDDPAYADAVRILLQLGR